MKDARPRRWLSAIKLVVLTTTLALAIAAGVVVAAVGAGAWMQAEAGSGSSAQLERYRGWARGAEVTGVVVAGSVLGLVWSRTTGGDRERRR